MHKTSLVFLGTFALSLASCASAPGPAVDVAAEEAEIRELEATDAENFTARDIDKIMTFYADDATFMTPGMAATKGRDAIRKALQGMMTDPNLKLEFSAQRLEIGKSGDVAFTQGSYLMTVSDPKTKKLVTDKGSYVTGYKKQADGSWKAVSDINVSEIPTGGVN